ncbi:hypothetical protein LguiA_022523 [Lonicera macranthoides]
MVTQSYSSMQPLCHNDDRDALLKFKHSLSLNKSASRDPFAYPKFASWKLERENDCCSTWDGVECDQDTGHVIGLELESSFLYGSIDANSSLFDLVHLQTLNLADNDFNYSQIPSEIAHFSMLSTLNLSCSVFYGQIPSEISGLSKLVSLDLSYNIDNDNVRLLKLEKPGLRGLVQNLSNLKEFDLSKVDISSQVPENLVNLTSLRSLALEYCGLYGEFPTSILHLPNLEILSASHNENLTGSLLGFHQISPLKILRLDFTSFSGVLPYSIGILSSMRILDFSACYFSGYLPTSLNNLTLLSSLDLSSNQFNGPIPILESLSQLTHLGLEENYMFNGGDLFWLGKLTKLKKLRLNNANLSGEIPSSLANLTQLARIGLAYNDLTGKIPSWLTNMTQVTFIYLSDNQLQGQIPSSFSQLKNLDLLNLERNSLSGMVEVGVFLSLKKLTQLLLRENQITLLTNNRTNETVPSFRVLSLSSCNLIEFPHFLRSQEELEVLLLRHNQIRGKIPEWVLNISKGTLGIISLGNNMLEGFDELPKVLPWVVLRYIDLSNNMLRGPLPIPSPNILCYKVSSNLLTGAVPSTFCSMSYVSTLDLSNNDMRGMIPPCLGNLSSLSILNLKGNKFSGNILQTYGKGNNLRMLDLSQNLLEGLMPRSLANCTNLEILNLADNKIEDTFPLWLGALPKLRILILRSNKFHGAVEGPTMNEDFPELRIIDLSNNGFTGYLPLGYFKIWKAMNIVHVDQVAYLKANMTMSVQQRTWDVSFEYTMTITIKSVKTNYEKILNVFTAIDLSSNKFNGEIPQSIENLKGLQSLNLSSNDLIGPIPPSLGQLSQLESLDLSRNKLSGEIQPQLVQLNFLEVLNVSYNNLSGPIPKGKQFNTFQNDSYEGNLALCGEPLSKRCGDPGPKQPLTIEEGDDSDFSSGVDGVFIFLGLGSGLVVGLISGWILTKRNHEWFVEKFGKRKANRRRK